MRLYSSFLFLVVALPLSATTYYVDNTNGSASNSNAGTSPALPWLTVAKCASTIVADDICTIQTGGSYDEAVTPVNSGTSGHPITYIAGVGAKPKIRRIDLTNKSYITVNGLEFTTSGFSVDANPTVLVTGTTGVQILNNYIHDTTSLGIRASSFGTKALNLLIKSNTLVNIGPAWNGTTGGRQQAIQLHADESLVDSNDISHSGDFTNVFGNRNVLRNNIFHDDYVSESVSANDHLDGMQTFCGGTAPGVTATYLLLEGNNYHDNPDVNEHFAIVNSTNGCGGATTVIMRENIILNFALAYIDNDLSDHDKFYNNTLVRGDSWESPKTQSTTVNFAVNATLESVLNNIFMDCCVTTGAPGVYALTAGGNGDYNLGYMSTGSITWGSPLNTETHHVLNQDPKLTNSTDVHLLPGSPAIKAGGALTTVDPTDTGSGTSLILADVHFFQDGWAGATPDQIAVGTTSNIALISSINYATNTITLTSGITRSSGQSVWLYQNSSGTRVLYGSAPDLGALPFTSVIPSATIFNGATLLNGAAVK